MTEDITVWAVYENPTDYPGKFVVRRWLPNPTNPDRPLAAIVPSAVADSLAEARQAIPPGMVRLAPDPDDDPRIVETWL